MYDSTTGALHSNISSSEPAFQVTALRPGLSFLMVTYAANAKGRSDVAQLETFMLKVAEKRTGKDRTRQLLLVCLTTVQLRD